MADLSHFDAQGQAHMVDVGDKPSTRRRAVAQGFITMQSETLQRVQAGDHRKGDVLGIARVAAIQGAKKTSDLIPLCHPLALTRVAVDFSVHERLPPEAGVSTQTPLTAIACMVTVETTGPTGVEMEALTAVQIGLLTIYDMCKAMDRAMCMTGIRLLEKQGGASGHYQAPSSV